MALIGKFIHSPRIADPPADELTRQNPPDRDIFHCFKQQLGDIGKVEKVE
jgi:hypothetical protein